MSLIKISFITTLAFGAETTRPLSRRWVRLTFLNVNVAEDAEMSMPRRTWPPPSTDTFDMRPLPVTEPPSEIPTTEFVTPK